MGYLVSHADCDPASEGTLNYGVALSNVRICDKMFLLLFLLSSAMACVQFLPFVFIMNFLECVSTQYFFVNGWYFEMRNEIFIVMFDCFPLVVSLPRTFWTG